MSLFLEVSILSLFIIASLAICFPLSCLFSSNSHQQFLKNFIMIFLVFIYGFWESMQTICFTKVM